MAVIVGAVTHHHVNNVPAGVHISRVQSPIARFACGRHRREGTASREGISNSSVTREHDRGPVGWPVWDDVEAYAPEVLVDQVARARVMDLVRTGQDGTHGKLTAVYNLTRMLNDSDEMERFCSDITAFLNRESL